MFTGIVQDIGRIDSRAARAGDIRLSIGVDRLDLNRIAVGDSICVQGVCLTVTELAGRAFAADVSRETLSLTTLGEMDAGSAVNLEPALRAGDALGGHLVSGHVDGIGTVLSTADDARSQRVTIAAPADLARYVARKGSVTIDGVSLTVNELQGTSFGVNLIPHTTAVTTLGRLVAGTRVNLEVDQVARYIERLLGTSGNVHGRAENP
jgi:riboflavin synthase